MRISSVAAADQHGNNRQHTTAAESYEGSRQLQIGIQREATKEIRYRRPQPEQSPSQKPQNLCLKTFMNVADLEGV
jgi:hypothetical protein